MIRRVYKRSQLAAIIIDFSSEISATTFFTDHESPLQIGIISKDFNQPVLPHRHNTFERKISATSEFLFVLEGSMTLTIFDENFAEPEYFDVAKGSGVLLLGGAHAIEFRNSAKLIEVKQGPYAAEMDKVYLVESDT
jgi:hypothetical protein